MKRNLAIQGLLVAIGGSLALLLAAAAASQTVPTGTDELTDDNYNIYNAVLNVVHFPPDVPTGLWDKTLNFKCGPGSGNPISFNGCGGVIMPPDTPNTVQTLLRRSWLGMEPATWKDFVRVNAQSVTLQNRFTTPWKHELLGDDISHADPKKQPSYGGTFFFSQVGLNPARTQAIVFVVFASAMPQVPSTGNYFLAHLEKSKSWKLIGRVQYFELGAGQS